MIQLNNSTGRYTIVHDSVYLIISEAMTENFSTIIAEIHEKYIDVQILLSGEETIGFGIQTIQNVKADKNIMIKKP